MMRSPVAFLLWTAIATSAFAQDMRFFYPAPPASTFQAINDVQYGTSGTDPLRLDVYRPAGTGVHPTLIFSNLAYGPQRSGTFYVTWAQIAASKGITAIVPDLRAESYSDDMTKLLEYLTSEGSAARGIDRDAIAVYAGSGNVSRTLPFVENPRAKAIKAAVMYYGAADVQQYRTDLPILFVRAGLDRPALNLAITRIVSEAVTQNAPWTLLNHPGGRHAFEIRNDDDATRRIIDDTLAFVKAATSPSYQTALRNALAEATAAGHVTAGRSAEAVTAYAALVKNRPDDPTLHLAYGEALLADKQFAVACAELEKLKGKSLGPRDLGIPAARACFQKGDVDAALAWLRGIPPQYRPNLLDDPMFASIREREEFKALFPPK
jgi:Tetratricopeptide repeat/Dienelactone hydrolase family